jgi:shikimate dehydrogenase
MPGSGKTSYGSILAKRLGREIIETDDEIVKAAGMEISELFEKYGEKHFRDLESDVIKKASLEGSKIISTGGGAVLRKENVDALSMNGKLVFLNRPLEELMPTEDRPLANDREKINALYAERLPIYLAAADAVVDLTGWDEADADRIWRAAL